MATEHYERQQYITIDWYHFSIVTRYLQTLRGPYTFNLLHVASCYNRYPLPLIQEPMKNRSKGKWFTKLDVSAAFHKIRINPRDEWKTAVGTPSSLYEWLVTPFGLANAPSTFHGYINWTLRKYIDEFCSAYLDDVLIYTNGSLSEHWKHVNTVLEALGEAGLSLDIKKCEFEVKLIKYLGVGDVKGKESNGMYWTYIGK